jgi:hypothetical protein
LLPIFERRAKAFFARDGLRVNRSFQTLQGERPYLLKFLESFLGDNSSPVLVVAWNSSITNACCESDGSFAICCAAQCGPFQRERPCLQTAKEIGRFLDTKAYDCPSLPLNARILASRLCATLLTLLLPSTVLLSVALLSDTTQLRTRLYFWTILNNKAHDFPLFHAECTDPSIPNACYAPDGSFAICCAAQCGPSSGNNPTCGRYGVDPSFDWSTTSARPMSTSGECPSETPNPCFTADSSAGFCCGGSGCGPSGGVLFPLVYLHRMLKSVFVLIVWWRVF